MEGIQAFDVLEFGEWDFAVGENGSTWTSSLYPSAPKRLINIRPDGKKKSNKSLSQHQLQELLDKPVSLRGINKLEAKAAKLKGHSVKDAPAALAAAGPAADTAVTAQPTAKEHAWRDKKRGAKAASLPSGDAHTPTAEAAQSAAKGAAVRPSVLGAAAAVANASVYPDHTPPPAKKQKNKYKQVEAAAPAAGSVLVKGSTRAASARAEASVAAAALWEAAAPGEALVSRQQPTQQQQQQAQRQQQVRKQLKQEDQQQQQAMERGVPSAEQQHKKQKQWPASQDQAATANASADAAAATATVGAANGCRRDGSKKADAADAGDGAEGSSQKRTAKKARVHTVAAAAGLLEVRTEPAVGGRAPAGAAAERPVPQPQQQSSQQQEAKGSKRVRGGAAAVEEGERGDAAATAGGRAGEGPGDADLSRGDAAAGPRGTGKGEPKQPGQQQHPHKQQSEPRKQQSGQAKDRKRGRSGADVEVEPPEIGDVEEAKQQGHSTKQPKREAGQRQQQPRSRKEDAGPRSGWETMAKAGKATGKKDEAKAGGAVADPAPAPQRPMAAPSLAAALGGCAAVNEPPDAPAAIGPLDASAAAKLAAGVVLPPAAAAAARPLPAGQKLTHAAALAALQQRNAAAAAAAAAAATAVAAADDDDDNGAGAGRGAAARTTWPGAATAGGKRKAAPAGFLEKMRAKLAGGRFRYLNEELYTRSGDDAFTMMQAQPELFSQYHDGFQRQTRGWPKQPVDVAICWLRARKSEIKVVADFGCGDAKIAASVPQTVHSFDLVASAPGVIACNMSAVPLPDAIVDAAVFSLALMGTDYGSFLEEAVRVLKPKGWLWIAEVRSRFARGGVEIGAEAGDEGDSDGDEVGGRGGGSGGEEDFRPFLSCLKRLGLKLVNEDAGNKMFVVWVLRKAEGDGAAAKRRKRGGIPWPELKACVYKKR